MKDLLSEINPYLRKYSSSIIFYAKNDHERGRYSKYQNKIFVNIEYFLKNDNDVDLDQLFQFLRYVITLYICTNKSNLCYDIIEQSVISWYKEFFGTILLKDNISDQVIELNKSIFLNKDMASVLRLDQLFQLIDPSNFKKLHYQTFLNNVIISNVKTSEYDNLTKDVFDKCYHSIFKGIPLDLGYKQELFDLSEIIAKAATIHTLPARCLVNQLYEL